MNNLVKHQLAQILQKEFLRRTLIKYLSDKGYDNFLVCPYPPTLRDLPDRIPWLAGLVEVAHAVEDINLLDNTVKISWNIFVNGNKRIFLGYTTHASLNEVENSLGAVDKHHDGPISLEKIVEAIVQFLGESQKLGDIHKLSGNSKANRTFGGRPFKAMPDMRHRF